MSASMRASCGTCAVVLAIQALALGAAAIATQSATRSHRADSAPVVAQSARGQAIVQLQAFHHP